MAVGYSQVTWDGARQQRVKGSLVGASVIHGGEMIAENLVLSPLMGGDGEEGGGIWCGRLRQRLGRLRSRSRLRTRARQISFLSKNAILVPSPQGGEGWQRYPETLRTILNGLDQPGGDKLLQLSLWGPGGPGGRTHSVPVSIGQPW